MYTISDSAYKLLKHDVLTILDTAVHHHMPKALDAPRQESYNYGVDSQLDPHLYFHFQFQGVYIYVRRYNKLFTVCCEHFSPALPSNRFIDNGFGEFASLDLALSAFKDCVLSVLTAYVGSEVIFQQLDLY